jgi:hypothetical protein
VGCQGKSCSYRISVGRGVEIDSKGEEASGVVGNYDGYDCARQPLSDVRGSVRGAFCDLGSVAASKNAGRDAGVAGLEAHSTNAGLRGLLHESARRATRLLLPIASG